MKYKKFLFIVSCIFLSYSLSAASISGYVFEDLNKNGKINSKEKGIEKVLVYIDKNRNSIPDEGERKAYTNNVGKYVLNGLKDNSQYSVKQDVSFGWRNISGGKGKNFKSIVLSNSSPSKRIVGGSIATEIQDYPFMVGIGKLSKEHDIFGTYCGGVLVSDSWVLTAAHCVYGSIVNNVQILAGTIDITDVKKKVLDNKSIHIHPDYNPLRPKDGSDIALIQLKKTIDLKRSNLETIPVISSEREFISASVGELATTIGFGEGNKKLDFLYEAHLPIADQEECKKIYPRADNFHLQVCAGYKEGEGVDACKGDSGGPLMIRIGKKWKLIGLTSYGRGCGKTFGVWTRVSKFKTWINSVITSSSRAYKVKIKNGSINNVNFGNISTILHEGSPIGKRWQLNKLTSIKQGNNLYLQWRIIDDIEWGENYECTISFKGTSIVKTVDECVSGINKWNLSSLGTGMYIPILEVKRKSKKMVQTLNAQIVGDIAISKTSAFLKDTQKYYIKDLINKPVLLKVHSNYKGRAVIYRSKKGNKPNWQKELSIKTSRKKNISKVFYPKEDFNYMIKLRKRGKAHQHHMYTIELINSNATLHTDAR